MDKYPNVVGPNQACTLYGTHPGLSTISGADYIKAGFSLDVNDLWRRNFVVIVGWLIFFIIAQVVVIQYFQVSHSAVFVFLGCLIKVTFLGSVTGWS